MNSLINPLQVGLTLAFLALCIYLLVVWWPTLKMAYREYRKTGRLSADQKLMVGIGIAFLASTIDNLYWGITWGAMEYNLPLHLWLVEQGPLGNIFFRQLPGIASVYFHLAAAVEMKSVNFDLGRLVYKVWALGAVATVIMILSR